MEAGLVARAERAVERGLGEGLALVARSETERGGGMTACISVPWALAKLAGQLLSDGHLIPTKEAPEVGRVYFLIPVTVGHDRWQFPDCDDFAIEYFWTLDEAMHWGVADIERRLMQETEQ
jgi:hypothetical protein